MVVYNDKHNIYLNTIVYNEKTLEIIHNTTMIKIDVTMAKILVNEWGFKGKCSRFKYWSLHGHKDGRISINGHETSKLSLDESVKFRQLCKLLAQHGDLEYMGF